MDPRQAGYLTQGMSCAWTAGSWDLEARRGDTTEDLNEGNGRVWAGSAEQMMGEHGSAKETRGGCCEDVRSFEGLSAR